MANQFISWDNFRKQASHQLQCLITQDDYAGPSPSRLVTHDLPKRWNASSHFVCTLLVCLATNAIYLEVVCELNTKAFIALIDRFISRRGNCTSINSDYGINFVGARNRFREITQFLRHTTTDTIILNHLNEQEIQWKHIPFRNPEAGGLWEPGLKSAKYHLTRVTNNFHCEELSRLMYQIEAILN